MLGEQVGQPCRGGREGAASMVEPRSDRKLSMSVCGRNEGVTKGLASVSHEEPSQRGENHGTEVESSKG